MSPLLPRKNDHATRLRIVLLSALLTLTVAASCQLQRSPSLEDEIARFLSDEDIAGAVVAIGPVGGRPEILSFGKADADRPMTPSDRFRLASLAKPVTAAAVLTLVRAGRLELDSPVPGAGPGITLRHLLQHSGGWDSERTFDPLADPAWAAKLGFVEDYRCDQVTDRVPPAEFPPGSAYSYSNLGYCRLGQAIERVTGEDYQDYVDRAVLKPVSAKLTFNGEPTVDHPSGWSQAAFDALGPGGGWTGSAEDYWLFAAARIDPLVRTKPSYAVPGEDYYGLGWRVWPDGTLSHFGAIPGSFTMVVRTRNSVAILLFNGRPRDDDAAFARLRAILAAHRR